MAKGTDAKPSAKKKATKTLLEKRKEKQDKKSQKTEIVIIKNPLKK